MENGVPAFIVYLLFVKSVRRLRRMVVNTRVGHPDKVVLYQRKIRLLSGKSDLSLDRNLVLAK